jgi:hypothetical protein
MSEGYILETYASEEIYFFCEEANNPKRTTITTTKI